jgi:hypothetical protein
MKNKIQHEGSNNVYQGADPDVMYRMYHLKGQPNNCHVLRQMNEIGIRSTSVLLSPNPPPPVTLESRSLFARPLLIPLA